METVRKTVLMTVQARSGTPSMAKAARMLGLTPDALDPEFGVVSIDPDACLFAVRAFADALPDGQDNDRSGGSGPYSDPDIAPFGIPRP